MWTPIFNGIATRCALPSYDSTESLTPSTTYAAISSHLFTVMISSQLLALCRCLQLLCFIFLYISAPFSNNNRTISTSRSSSDKLRPNGHSIVIPLDQRGDDSDARESCLRATTLSRYHFCRERLKSQKGNFRIASTKNWSQRQETIAFRFYLYVYRRLKSKLMKATTCFISYFYQ